MPSKITADFVPRTLRRLLPDPALLAGRQLVEFARKKDELSALIKDEPVRFFTPSPGGQWDFMTCFDPEIQVEAVFAGNKSGKTTAGAIKCGEIVLGRPLWGEVGTRWKTEDERAEFCELLASRVPVRACFQCEDFDTFDETILPTFFSWFPRSEVEKAPQVPLSKAASHQIFFKNGSVVFLRTYSQNIQSKEGKDYDLIWDDEPPPYPVYTANFRGLVVTKGLMIITATLVSEVWLYDEMDKSFVRSFEATIHDNKWLSESAKTNFLASINDEGERLTRETGRPAALVGKIYPNFRDDFPHVIDAPASGYFWDPAEEAAWPVILGVDPHERKPLFCKWGYVTPKNGVIWFDWRLIPSGALSEIQATLREVESKHLSPTALVVMDPNRGIQRQLGGQSWKDTFETFGYSVLLGDDNMSFGHGAVREMLAFERDLDGKPKSEPLMRWTAECRGKGGPIFQLSHYTWDDYSRSIRSERPQKEKPKELFKDFPDIDRYTAVALKAGFIDFNELFDLGDAPLVQLFNQGSRLASRAM